MSQPAENQPVENQSPAANTNNNNTNNNNNNKTVKIAVAVAAVAVAASIGFGVYAMSGRNTEEDGKQTIGYASEAKVLLDQESLQDAVDRAMENARNGKIALQYRNDATSDDGKTFSCRIVNSASNKYDMFLTIFADAELTDQIFLSGLVPPGSGFEEITLDRALETGDHTVYVALSQVDTDENGDQVMKGQAVHTMEFHVS